MKKFICSVLTASIAASMLCAGTIVSFAEEEVSNILGDITLNEVVDIKDVTEIQKSVAELITLSDTQKKLADVNADDFVNIIDATLIQKYIVELETGYDIGNAIDTPEEPLAVAVKAVFSNEAVALYDASGNTVTEASNILISNNTYAEIVEPVDIEVSGSCENGQLSVNIDKQLYPDESSAIEITLNGLTLSNSNDSPIYVASIEDWCTLSVKKSSINTISDGTSYLNKDNDAAAIYSKDDLKIKGKGTLNVYGNCAYGICSKDDLKLWNGTINVFAAGTGIKGKDSVRIGDPDDFGVAKAYDNLIVNIESGEDGIRSNNAVDEGKGYINIQGGTVKIESQQDALQAEQELTINGGTIDITTYKGSSSTVPSNSTAKGIKSEGALNLNGGEITVNSSDDSIHCGDVLTFAGGTYTLSSGDDGIHSDNIVNVNGGDITVLKSYEGLEGYFIYINDGYINITSSDDGINAAGGNDSSSPSFGGGFRPGGMGGESSSTGYMYINGGMIIVNANGDGLDANGSITMTGGTVVVSGSENSGNGALDYDSTFTMSGGTLFASGASGMAQNISNASGVCSVLINTSTNVTANSMLAVNNSNGDNLITVNTPKKCNSFLFASADLTTGSSYTLYSGGTYDGENIAERYYYNGTYTPGASLATWTQSSAIQSSSQGGGSTRPRMS